MSSSKILEFKKTAFLNKSNSAFIEEMYLKFVNNDPELPDSWRKYFKEVGDEDDIIVNEINGPSWSPSKKVSINKKQNFENQITEQNDDDIIKSNTNSIKAVAMIRSYRQRGHLIAKLDTLGLLKTDYLEELHPESYGLKKEDYQKKIFLDGVTNKQYSNITEILNFLRDKYCGSLGYEYMHISNPTERFTVNPYAPSTNFGTRYSASSSVLNINSQFWVSSLAICLASASVPAIIGLKPGRMIILSGSRR